MNPKLVALTSDQLAVATWFHSTPPQLRRALAARPEVRELRQACLAGEVDERMLAVWVDDLMSDFRAGFRFPHEIALAGLAVVLEGRQSEFAEEFLTSLGALRVAEVARASGVVRDVLESRAALTMDLVRSRSFADRTVGEFHPLEENRAPLVPEDVQNVQTGSP